MEILFFLLTVYMVTATIRCAWDPEEYEPLLGWRGWLRLVLGLLVAVVILGIVLALWG